MGFDVIAAMNAEYPTLKSQGWVDFNQNGKKDENEEINDVNGNGRVGDEDDYYAFVGANAQHIRREIIDGAVDSNIAVLEDEDQELYARKAAAWALGEIKDSRAVEPLINALEDWYKFVRNAAVEALVKIGEPAVEPLIAAWKDKNFARNLSDIFDAYRAVAEVLAKIGEPAVGFLIAALKDENWYIRNAAAWALGEKKTAGQ